MGHRVKSVSVCLFWLFWCSVFLTCVYLIEGGEEKGWHASSVHQ